MKKLLVTLLFVLALVTPFHAQAQDEAPGSQSQFVAAINTGGYGCGVYVLPTIACNPVSTSIGGWFGLFVNTQTSTGYISFTSVADLGQATITSVVTTSGSQTKIKQLTVTFKGNTNDGDGGTYTGTGVFTFAYYGTNGNKQNSLILSLTSGTLTIKYN